MALFVSTFVFYVEAENVDKINITEIMDDPVKNPENKKTEWIEFYANEDLEFLAPGNVNAKGYRTIKDFYLCTKKDLAGDAKNFCKNSYPVYAVDEKTNIKKGELVLIVNDPLIFQSTYPKKDGLIILQSNFNLLSTKDAHLSFSLDGKKNWQDKTDYADFFAEREKEHSLEIKDGAVFSGEASAWQQSVNIGGTPGSINSTGFVKEVESVPIAPQNIIIGKLTMDENIYPNVYANFEIQKNTDEKVTWTFGDGHKSYLVKTKHKFDLAGTYEASVKVYKGKINAIKNFKIIVESFPHPKIRIVGINANPKGSDTKNETITIENKSKKKINLKGWSVATGWKKFINHPIREDFEIKPGKEKQLTRNICAFTLNNDKNKIQLRYPDGEVANDMKYKSPIKSIAEGEKYIKVKGGWKWIGGKNSESHQPSVISKQDIKENTIEIVQEEKVDEKVAWVEIAKRENKLLVRDDLVKIELLNNIPRVLGAEIVREKNGQYFFTPESLEKEHYAIIFFKNIIYLANKRVNMVLNFF